MGILLKNIIGKESLSFWSSTGNKGVSPAPSEKQRERPDNLNSDYQVQKIYEWKYLKIAIFLQMNLIQGSLHKKQRGLYSG